MSTQSNRLSAEYAGVIICQEVDWEYPFFSRRRPYQESVGAHGHPAPPNEGGNRSNDALARRRDVAHSLATSVPPVIKSSLNLPNDSEIFYFPRSPEYAAYPLHRSVVFTRGNTKGLSLWRVRAADIMGVDFVNSPMSCAITSKPYQTTIRLLFDWPLPPGKIQERPRHVTHTRVIDIGTFNANPHKKNMYMRTAALARGVAYTVQEEIYALLKVKPNLTAPIFRGSSTYVDLGKIDINGVLLMGLNYYPETDVWVPALAAPFAVIRRALVE